MDTPTLSRIEIFPIKSLDGVVLQDATLLPSGALKGDRQYALLDSQGKFVNGKANPLIHRLRASFDAALTTVTLHRQGSQERYAFDLMGDRTPLEAWLSQYFNQPITVQANPITGFPDDLNAPGPTLITTATLRTVARWYPDLTLEEVRRRFRTNLEFEATPSFWEDALYGEPQQTVPISVGEVILEGVNPCQRCVVPTRNSWEGTPDRQFQQQFVRQRRATLPDWAPLARFNHFYKLAVNTRLAPHTPSYQLKVGDRVQV